jgi:hypothetical protein
MNPTPEMKRFCIYDYFLDGHYIQMEQVDHCYLPTAGENREIVTRDGRKIAVTVTETEKISESEYRVLLVSA